LERNTLKKLLFIAYLFLSMTQSYAQKQQFFSFELGGSGGLASINYEQNYLEKKNYFLQARFGFSYGPIDANNGGVLIFPIMTHAVIGPKNHKLDIGIGQTLSITTKGNFFILMPSSIGYRYQPSSKNYYWRFAYTPIFSYLIDFQMQQWGGITYGYNFSRR
jgi:hypothetical protein